MSIHLRKNLQFFCKIVSVFQLYRLQDGVFEMLFVRMRLSIASPAGAKSEISFFFNLRRDMMSSSLI